jgi:hypothetical protein
MARCSGITASGDQCALAATPGNAYCYGHDPARAAERKANASKAARAKHGPTELAEIKGELRDLIRAILDGQIKREIATPAVMGFNTLLRAVEIERKIEEQEELLTRLEALEEAERSTKW